MEANYKCEICGKEFKTEHALKMHMVSCSQKNGVSTTEISLVVQEKKPKIKQKTVDEKIIEFVEYKQGKNRWTTEDVTTAYSIYVEKLGKSPGSETCPGCIQHCWNVLQANYDILKK
jgi:hypothetical protein